jgi:hypothetical protein
LDGRRTEPLAGSPADVDFLPGVIDQEGPKAQDKDKTRRIVYCVLVQHKRQRVIVRLAEVPGGRKRRCVKKLEGVFTAPMEAFR